MSYNGYRIFRDGNMWCAVGPHFRNPQQDHAGFGETPELAYEALMLNDGYRAKMHNLGLALPLFVNFEVLT